MQNKIFEKDLYRYYAGKESIKQRILRPLEIKYIYNMIGNPATIHKNIEATKDYIGNIV